MAPRQDLERRETPNTSPGGSFKNGASVAVTLALAGLIVVRIWPSAEADREPPEDTPPPADQQALDTSAPPVEVALRALELPPPPAPEQPAAPVAEAVPEPQVPPEPAPAPDTPEIAEELPEETPDQVVAAEPPPAPAPPELEITPLAAPDPAPEPTPAPREVAALTPDPSPEAAADPEPARQPAPQPEPQEVTPLRPEAAPVPEPVEAAEPIEVAEPVEIQEPVRERIRELAPLKEITPLKEQPAIKQLAALREARKAKPEPVPEKKTLPAKPAPKSSVSPKTKPPSAKSAQAPLTRKEVQMHEREGRVLLRLLEFGSGPRIEIGWPDGAGAREALFRAFSRCYGMRVAYIDRQGRLFTATGPKGQAWILNRDRFSGFLRQASGDLGGGERKALAAIERHHQRRDLGHAVRLFPRRSDAVLLGGIGRIVGDTYRGVDVISARYVLSPRGVQVVDIRADGRPLKGRIDLLAQSGCSL